MTCPTALDFLAQFPTPEALQPQTQTDWCRFLDEHKVFNPKARQRFLTALSGPKLTVDKAMVSAKSLLTETLVTQLQSLTKALDVYEKRMRALLEGFDDSDLFRSLPGVSLILAAKLWVGIGTDRERFEHANELQTFFVTAPYTKSSGQHRSVHFRFGCHKGMRAALQQLAFS